MQDKFDNKYTKWSLCQSSNFLWETPNFHFSLFPIFPDLLLCHQTCFKQSNSAGCLRQSPPKDYADAQDTAHHPKRALLSFSQLEENSINE